MKLILLGYMGSGKTTLGKLLSSKLNTHFYDLDEYIIQKEKLTISEIFNQKGEIYFRLKEHEYLKEILNMPDNIVLSLGGGTPCYANNMNIIKQYKNATSCFLQTSIQNLVERLNSDKNSRPLIHKLSDEKRAEFIAKHLFERNPFYQQADLKIKTDDLTPEEVSSQILKQL